MHELSICRTLILKVDAVALHHQARRVARVRLRMGPLSGVDPVLLRHAFLSISTGTRVEGAVLTIDEAPLRVVCDSCGASTDAYPNHLSCAQCGDWRTRLVSGDELTLDSIELMLDAPAAVPEANRV